MAETETERVVLSEAEVYALSHLFERNHFDRMIEAVERILADRHAALLAEVTASREAMTRESLAAALHQMAVEDNPGHSDWHDCATTGPCADEGNRLRAALAALTERAGA